MVAQSQNLSGQYSSADFFQAPAESLPTIKAQEVDLATASQSAHWLNYPKLWPELARIVRPGGSLAFWGYKDHVLVSYPKASEIIQHYAYRRYAARILLAATRTSGLGTRFLSAKMTLGAMEEYIRTWSSFHKWQQKFADRARRGPEGNRRGDIIDEMMDEVRDVEPALRESNEKPWKEIQVDVEWESALILARRLT